MNKIINFLMSDIALIFEAAGIIVTIIIGFWNKSKTAKRIALIIIFFTLMLLIMHFFWKEENELENSDQGIENSLEWDGKKVNKIEDVDFGDSEFINLKIKIKEAVVYQYLQAGRSVLLSKPIANEPIKIYLYNRDFNVIFMKFINGFDELTGLKEYIFAAILCGNYSALIEVDGYIPYKNNVLITTENQRDGFVNYSFNMTPKKQSQTVAFTLFVKDRKGNSISDAHCSLAIEESKLPTAVITDSKGEICSYGLVANYGTEIFTDIDQWDEELNLSTYHAVLKATENTTYFIKLDNMENASVMTSSEYYGY